MTRLVMNYRLSIKMIIEIQEAIKAFKNINKPMNAPSNTKVDLPKVDKRLSG